VNWLFIGLSWDEQREGRAVGPVGPMVDPAQWCLIFLTAVAAPSELTR
jgi:hypothetical protein